MHTHYLVLFGRKIKNTLWGISDTQGKNPLSATQDYFELQAQVLSTSEDDSETALQEDVDVNMTSETTQFIDSIAGERVSAASAVDTLANSDAVDKASLAKFLSRPVRVWSQAWSISDSTGELGSAWSPWSNFFNNQYIKYKVNNFAFIRCNLHVKFVVNASPFYYGAIRMNYTPLYNFVEDDTSWGDSDMRLVRNSQKPGVWLYPGRSEGAEMEIPFFYYKSLANLTGAAEIDGLGHFQAQIYAPLSSANGVSSQTCSITAFAWATEVELAGPTLQLAMQGDEYGDNPVSAPATAMAKVASKAKTIPVIGKLAAATEIGANAVSGMAKLFGYTNTPVIEPAKPVRSSPFPQLASGDIGFPVEKLTVDSKNELSIDPTVVGLGPDDELSIPYLVQKESYIQKVTWTNSDAVDASLFSAVVNPWFFTTRLNGTVRQVQPTPMGMVSQLFNNWRGDLIFKFKFIASPFHKGRIRIQYDPLGSSMAGTTDYGMILNNTIVDLGTSREVEVRVPYQQATAWCNVPISNSAVPYTPSMRPHVSGNDNGVISMKVINVLTAPVSTASVSILVSVRGAENLEFANPCNLLNNYTAFTIQSEEISMGETKGGSPETYRVHFGEKIESLRPLLSRSNYQDTLLGPVAGGTYHNILKYYWPRKPTFFGYDPHGVTYAKGTVVTASSFKFTYAANSPYHWISRAFVAQRGAFHWHFNVTTKSGNPVSHIEVFRDVLGEGTNSYSSLQSSATTIRSQYAAFVPGHFSTCAGEALTNGHTQSAVSVSLPNTSMYRFQSNNPNTVLNPYDDNTYLDDGSKNEFVAVHVFRGGTESSDDIFVHRFFSCGTDFSLYFFLAAPMWNYMASYPTPE